MMVTLFTSTSTSLYSTRWTPSTTGQYAGTCIFIIILGAIFRGLFSYRAMQEHRWRGVELKRRHILVSGKKQDDEGARLDEDDIGAGDRTRRRIRPWRISTDVPRALLDTVIAGVGYLLMLAVMTMNVGYFLSVLGGIFLGSLMFGRHAVHFAP
ncbi:MAG: hypothetical protein ALECFALPRED_004891 [Alectoria fallacina]|uniref:Copper transport protein n=1 Tax=Alectoria fallacina TaxID=1903189 RepID=A0A8H3HZ95_9LECA|nr:MAG: hypothetical protein ALECFALPRED_004891 [Alectoria fallacina]